uniref:Ubiquitin carboxyl-terminal hydrolase MINDY n=1 Tax=Erpetoichthys calabaricus TaxID=27687 RepID=A0A8C4S8V9_ERPCA
MDNGNTVVEEVAASLVREYLSRKGLKKTIMCMDEELPRTDLSINNRNELRKILHLDSLSADDKTHISYTKAPFKTSPGYIKAAILQAGSSEPSSEGEWENLPKFMSSANDNEGVRSAFSTGEVKNAFAELQKQRSTRPLRGMMAGPISSSQDVSIQYLHYYKFELKKLLFGSSNACFNEEWKIQSFVFSELPDLRYGIVQKKGGSCGILASVQACVLQKLLFEDGSSDSRTHKCLALAIAEILWRAVAIKMLLIITIQYFFSSKPLHLLYQIFIFPHLQVILNTVNTVEDLTLFLEQNIQQFELGPYGCILLTLSAIFSRSMDLIRKDFDVPSNTLIGAHGYCTQELVNLLLTGKAVSNVFNDEIQLDSGNGNITLLKGIKGRSDIGLLSLFEHYNVCKVGSYLKTPRYPIWVVCSESHFSVLFCLRKELLSDWRIERRFDLYYYDGLANQEEEIRLTVGKCC